MKNGLDDLDRRLLAALQDDARRSSAELARKLKLSGPGLQKRLRKLEDRGVIRRYATVVDREADGLDLLCFVHIMLAHHRPDAIKQFPDRKADARSVNFGGGPFQITLEPASGGLRVDAVLQGDVQVR